MKYVSILVLLALGQIVLLAQSVLPATIPVDNIDYEVYFIGNVAYGHQSLEDHPVLSAVKSQLPLTPYPKSVVFLGNVLGEKGLPETSQAEYIDLHQQLQDDLNYFERHTDRTLLVPGNHEWSDGHRYSLEALKDSEDFIESIVDDKNIMAPSKGCGEPEVIHLTEDFVLVLVDSQWILMGDESDERKRSSCDVDDALEFVAELQVILAANKRRNIIIAAHHPVYTNGPTGGNYTLKDHLLPLPVLGTLITTVRKLGVKSQKFGHPSYEAYRSAMNTALSNFDGSVMIAAHDHSLQHLEIDDKHFVVSGSGSMAGHVGKSKEASYLSKELGYAKFVHTKDLDLYLEFYNLDNDRSPILIYRKLIDKKYFKKESKEVDYSSYDVKDEDVPIQASTLYAKKKFGLGKTYRKEWSTVVDAPVLKLDETDGGLSQWWYGHSSVWVGS